MFTQHLAESRARRQKQQHCRLQHKPCDESGFFMTRGRGRNGPHVSQSPLQNSATYSRGGTQRVVVVLSKMEPVWITPLCTPVCMHGPVHSQLAAAPDGPEAGQKVRVAEELFMFNHSNSSPRTLRCFTGLVKPSNVHVMLTQSIPVAWLGRHGGVLAATKHQQQSQYPRYSAAAPSLVPSPGQAGCITSPVHLFSCTSACHTSRQQQLAGARSELSTAACSGCTRRPTQICTAGSLLRARARSWLCLCAPCPCEPAACSQQESAAGGFSHGSTLEPNKAEHQCRDSSTVISTRGST